MYLYFPYLLWFTGMFVKMRVLSIRKLRLIKHTLIFTDDDA